MQLYLEDKIVLVMNGDSIIGRKIVKEFVNENARVIIHHEKQKIFSLTELNLEISDGKHEVEIMSAKLDNIDEPRNMITEIVSKFGKIDVFVYTHPPVSMNSIRTIDYQIWNETVRKGLKTIYTSTRSLTKHFARQKEGRIIYVTFGAGARGYEDLVDRCTIGGGIVGFAKSLSKELVSYNVPVNCITYGLIEEEFSSYPLEAQRELRKILDYLGIKRLGTTIDIANTVLFLASQKSEYITGQTLYVNGGLLV